MSREMIILGGNRITGKNAPFKYIEYWVDEANRGYLVHDMDGECDFEEMLDLLTELVETHHGADHGRRAYEAGREQLSEKDWAAEWARTYIRIAAYHRWGGHPPKAVLQFDELDPKQLVLVVPEDDGLGDIKVHRLRPEAQKMLADVLPYPEEGHNARRGEFGWEVKPPEASVERKRLQKHLIQAKIRGMGEKRVVLQD